MKITSPQRVFSLCFSVFHNMSSPAVSPARTEGFVCWGWKAASGPASGSISVFSLGEFLHLWKRQIEVKGGSEKRSALGGCLCMLCALPLSRSMTFGWVFTFTFSFSRLFLQSGTNVKINTLARQTPLCNYIVRFLLTHHNFCPPSCTHSLQQHPSQTPQSGSDSFWTYHSDRERHLRVRVCLRLRRWWCVCVPTHLMDACG